MRAGQPREKEAVDAVGDRASEDLRERSRVTAVSPSEGVQVSRAFSLVDHGGRVPVANEKEVRRQPADSPVSVTERVDPLEASVEIGDEKHHVPVTARPPLGISQSMGLLRHPHNPLSDSQSTRPDNRVVRVMTD